MTCHSDPALREKNLLLVAAPPRYSTGAVFFSCREEKIHHGAHRDHREKYFCASRDYKVTVPCSLTHSLCRRLFSVTSVVPQARDEVLTWVAAILRCSTRRT